MKTRRARSSAKLTRVVLMLIFLKAWMGISERPAFQRRRQRRLYVRRAQTHSYRVIFGARLRRLTRAKNPKNRDLRAKVVALLNLLNKIDTHAARLAKRLASGLTRRVGGFKHEARGVALASCSPPDLYCADTS